MVEFWILDSGFWIGCGWNRLKSVWVALARLRRNQKEKEGVAAKNHTRRKKEGISFLCLWQNVAALGSDFLRLNGLKG